MRGTDQDQSRGRRGEGRHGLEPLPGFSQEQMSETGYVP